MRPAAVAIMCTTRCTSAQATPLLSPRAQSSRGQRPGWPRSGVWDICYDTQLPQLDAATQWHPHTHVRRRVFGQVPSSCCSPPPPVKAGRAPSRALIRRAQRDRRVPRQLVGGSTTTQGHRTQEEPGTAGAQRGLRAAKLLPALQMLQRQPPSRVVGSATSVAPPHTPEARDHQTRATRPASTARVSPAQPWVPAPNTSALARHGDSLCQRRRQSSCHSFHHHDTDSHCQFRPRHNPQLDAATHTHTFAVASSDRYPAAVVRLLPP